MKLFILLACFLVVSVSALAPVKQATEKVQFAAFKLANKKTYKNEAEEIKRFTIFKENLRSIEAHNALFKKGLTTWTQRVNKFADLTRAEFLATLGTRSSAKPLKGAKYVESKLPVPSSIDWRTRGQVNTVRDQGTTCASGWAFALIGASEAAYYRKRKQLISLSEQQLVDCAGGCGGSYTESTLSYLLDFGFQSGSDYGYSGSKDGFCESESYLTKTKLSGYNILAPGNENQLLNAVGTVGPVPAIIDASYLAFYDSGVYSDKSCSKNSISHGVLVVGYGSEGGKNYWIVKNSWGSNWGANGYFKILRGKNECGIAEKNVLLTVVD